MLIAALALAAADPVPPTPPAETTAQAAVRVVQGYYAAIRRHDYRTAYAIWHDGHDYAAFRRGYATTRAAWVTPLPPYDVEGAAGSSYAEIKVRVDAVLADGTRQRFAGSYTLRRVNDIEGSSAAQRRWHIEGAKLRQMR